MGSGKKNEAWGTRFGVILAVMGSAVGLGNFLRFPGLAAEYQGAFMVPYIIALLLLGLPIAWAEWTMGRYGGVRGFNSAPGIFRLIWRNPVSPFLGVFGLIIPVMIYMYYVFIESWCLGYAFAFLQAILNPGTGLDLGKGDLGPYQDYFGTYVGINEDGALFKNPGLPLIFLGICIVLNFVLIYRGLSKGIEWFCIRAMPLLIVCGVIVLIRVLTLPTDPNTPELNTNNALGHMWNPSGSGHLMQNVKTIDIQVSGQDDHSSLLLDAVSYAVEASYLKGKTYEIVDGAAADAILSIELEKYAQALSTKGEAPEYGAKISGRATLVNTKHPDGETTVLRNIRIGGKSEKESDEPTAMAKAAAGISAKIVKNTPVQKGFFTALANPTMWLEAAGQIFFSLSVGFGVIITYSSYLRRKDDIALSSTTAVSGNEFCEVALGGLITIPAAFLFLGPAGAGGGTFGLGFQTLPMVFQYMPFGNYIGFLFFFLLFLAAVTSSLSMLQPAIAFLEEGLGLNRKGSVAMLGFITIIGTGFIVWFSAGVQALDTIDFWVGSVCIYVLATIQIILFGWVMGIEKGFNELNTGASLKIPRWMGFIMKYVCPTYLLIIFVAFVWQKSASYLDAIMGNLVTQLSIGFIIIVTGFFLLLIAQSVRNWDQNHPVDKIEE